MNTLITVIAAADTLIITGLLIALIRNGRLRRPHLPRIPNATGEGAIEAICDFLDDEYEQLCSLLDTVKDLSERVSRAEKALEKAKEEFETHKKETK